MPEPRFGRDDIDRWVAQGLITSEQRAALLDDLARRPAAAAGLTLTTLLYYGGGLLVLLAYSVFLGFQWGDLHEGGRVVIAALSFVFFAGVSLVLLRTEAFRLPGELLQVVAVAVVPLLLFAALDAGGWWPEDPGFRAAADIQEQYHTDLTWARMGMAGATLLVAFGAFAVSRSPFVLVAALVALTSFLVDASLQVLRPGESYELESPQTMLIAVVGGATLVAGIMVRGRTQRDYALWLWLAGLAGLTMGLGSQALAVDAATGWGGLWMVVSLVVLAMAVPLQERLFAVAGLAGVFVYLARLVFDVFETANAALVLVVIGLLVLGAGMLYQRYTGRFLPGARA